MASTFAFACFDREGFSASCEVVFLPFLGCMCVANHLLMGEVFNENRLLSVGTMLQPELFVDVDKYETKNWKIAAVHWPKLTWTGNSVISCIHSNYTQLCPFASK